MEDVLVGVVGEPDVSAVTKGALHGFYFFGLSGIVRWRWDIMCFNICLLLICILKFAYFNVVFVLKSQRTLWTCL